MSAVVSAHWEHEDVARYLRHCLEKRLVPAAIEWLFQECDQIARDASPLSLYTAFSAAPRKIGKSALMLDDGELEEAAAVRPLWKPDQWSADQAARCLLLLARDRADADSEVAMIEKLFSTADARELVALYQALPLLAYQDRYRARAAEGLRSNMVNVFHAIALNNPYPFEQFDELTWNRGVLKVAFIGSPMRDIIGLEHRANPALARMLRDLVHERRAAGRRFPAEIWQLIAPYADAAMIDDMRRALDDDDESQRVAAEAALAGAGNGDRAEGSAVPTARISAEVAPQYITLEISG